MQRFSTNSQAGMLVDRMVELVGNGDKSKGRDFFLKRGQMTQAEFYNGLWFHWKRETMTTVGGQELTLLMPTQYLGEVE